MTLSRVFDALESKSTEYYPHPPRVDCILLTPYCSIFSGSP